jgi:hypothetical protein
MAVTTTAAMACEREASIGSSAQPLGDAGAAIDATRPNTEDAGRDAYLDETSLPPSNVAGGYSVALVNETNDCAFDNFIPGNTTAGVPITVVQEAAAPQAARVTVGGFPAIFYNFVLGSADYAAAVSGSMIDGILYGNVDGKRQGCNVTYNARVSATITGDVIRGTFVYYSIQKSDAGCSAQECTSTQNFSGTKPRP